MVRPISNLCARKPTGTTTTTTSVRRSCRSEADPSHPSGRGALVVDDNGVAQPRPMLPAKMKGFLNLTFLVVRLDGVQVTECWYPNEQVGQELVGLGWHEEALWTRDGS